MIEMKFKSCSVDGCERNAHNRAKGCRGLCYPHYQRFMRNGDPTAGWTSPGKVLDFVNNVALEHDGIDCLFWPFSRGNGYGQVKIDGRPIGAHRYICILVHGEPPSPDHQAAHSCGNGHLACVSPMHISWKTPAENSEDRVLHGTSMRGEHNANAKLTNEQAKQILSLKGVSRQADIATKFGVSISTVGDIHRGNKWRWLSHAYRKEASNAD